MISRLYILLFLLLGFYLINGAPIVKRVKRRGGGFGHSHGEGSYANFFGVPWQFWLGYGCSMAGFTLLCCCIGPCLGKACGDEVGLPPWLAGLLGCCFCIPCLWIPALIWTFFCGKETCDDCG